MHTKAITFVDRNRVELREYKLGDCGPKDIVVRTHYTMVSSGTELRILGGHYGAEGRYPLIPGYSAVGEVTAVGAEVHGFRIGDYVSGRNPCPLPGVNAMWGGQAGQHVYTTEGEDRPVLLPANAHTLDYVIAEISAISLRGVLAAAPQAGETAVVLGQGLIGAFSSAWLNAAGCRVIVADLAQGRLERALARGAAAAINIGEADAEARLQTLCNGGADIVVESSGTTPGVLLAFRLLRRKPQAYGDDYKVEPIGFYHQDWPRLIMQANYIEAVPVNPHSFFGGEGVTILTPMDRGVEDRQRAVEALRNETLCAADFIGEPVAAHDAPDAYVTLRDNPGSHFSLVIDWTNA